MKKLHDYVIFQTSSIQGSMLIRKLEGKKEFGISMDKSEDYGFAGWACPEFFLNKKEALEMIKAIKEYFDIK